MVKPLIIRVVGQNGGGGSAVYCYQLNMYLEEQGFETLTFIPRPTFDDRYTLQGKVGLDYRHSTSFLAVAWQALKNRKRLLFIHSHLRNATFWMYLLTSILSVRHVVTAHIPLYEDVPTFKDRVLSKMFGFALKDASLSLFISKFAAEKVCHQAGVSFSKLDAAIVYNGSNGPSVVRYLAREEHPLRICVVGELTARKNSADLIWLAKRLHEAGLEERVVISVFGRGPGEAELAETSVITKLLHLKGYESDVDQIYENSHLHMILSKNEAFGRVVTEAMARSIPTVCYRAGAFPELIDNGKDGFLVDSRDELLACVRMLLADPRRLERVGAASRQTFESSGIGGMLIPHVRWTNFCSK